MDEDKNHRYLCIALAKLSKDYPDMLKYVSNCLKFLSFNRINSQLYFRFSLEYFNKHGAPWESIDELLPTPPKRSKIHHSSTMDEILEAVFIYLQICSSHFRKSWDWSHFIEQFKNIDDKYSKW